jgi:hypothetical protein
MSTGDNVYFRDCNWAYATTATSVSSGTYGIDSYKTSLAQASIPDVERLKDKLANLEALFFRKVVSKCPACGQWGAALCECKHCGHPIDLGEMP